ncbi:hypothetical protein Tco_0739655 [Tanacetum coccineum]
MTSRPRTRIPSRPRWGVTMESRSQVTEKPGTSSYCEYSDSSDESVGSPASRVILFGNIPTVIPSTSVVAPETSTIGALVYYHLSSSKTYTTNGAI